MAKNPAHCFSYSLHPSPPLFPGHTDLTVSVMQHCSISPWHTRPDSSVCPHVFRLSITRTVQRDTADKHDECWLGLTLTASIKIITDYNPYPRSQIPLPQHCRQQWLYKGDIQYTE